MCNRYALSVPTASLFPRYKATEAANPVALPAPELFPRKPAYVVREADGVRIVDVLAWGFPMMTKGKSGKDIRKDVIKPTVSRSIEAAATALEGDYGIEPC